MPVSLLLFAIALSLTKALETQQQDPLLQHARRKLVSGPIGSVFPDQYLVSLDSSITNIHEAVASLCDGWHVQVLHVYDSDLVQGFAVANVTASHLDFLLHQEHVERVEEVSHIPTREFTTVDNGAGTLAKRDEIAQLTCPFY